MELMAFVSDWVGIGLYKGLGGCIKFGRWEVDIVYGHCNNEFSHLE